MSAIAEPSIAAIRADFRRFDRSFVLHRLRLAIAARREHAMDRAVARDLRRIAHPEILADFDAARRFRCGECR